MGNQDYVGEHDTDLDSPSCADTTAGVDHGDPITLNIFTATYNVNGAPIATVMNIPTDAKDRL